MLISFLQYQVPVENGINIDGMQSVTSFKLLIVMLREDLSWSDPADYVTMKANSKLYGLKQLKNAGLSHKDFVTI
jgi:uncharacterized protein YciW